MTSRALLKSVAIATVVVVAGVIAPSARAQPSADVAVSKSAPALAAADSDVTYSVSVANFGLDDADTVTLTDPIPAGMTFVSAAQDSGPAFVCSTPPVGSGGTISCSIALLAAGGTADFTFIVHMPPATPPGTTFVNIASVSTVTPDPNDENNSSAAGTSTPPPPQADMAVTKQGPPFAGPDTDVVFTIALTNGGPDPGTTVSLDDTLPGTMTFVSLVQNSEPAMACSTPGVGSGGTITCTASPFAAGATANFTLTAHVPPGTFSGTLFTNTATVSSDSDPNSENDSSTVTVEISSVDLAVLKSGPATVVPGTNITYTVTVSNGGPDAGSNVQLNDPIPSTTTFVSLTQDTGPAASCVTPTGGPGGTVSCSFSTLAAAATAQFTLVVQAGGASVTNTASVTSDSFDPNASNNSSGVTTTITTTPTDVSVTKSAGSGPFFTGQLAAFTVVVTNNGPATAFGIMVTDVLPSGTTLTSASTTQGSCTGTSTVTCNIGTLAVSAAATVVLNVTLPSASGPLSNTATLTMDNADPIPGNNSSSVTITVAALASIPALQPLALALLALALAMAGVVARTH